MRREEVKARHGRLRNGRGMATTSGRTLVLCDCRNRIQQDCTLKDGARTKKMAAAGDFGSDVQVRTKESIARDSGDGIDSYRYFCESLIVSVFCGLRHLDSCRPTIS